jgi:hypothetical protein
MRCSRNRGNVQDSLLDDADSSQISALQDEFTLLYSMDVGSSFEQFSSSRGGFTPVPGGLLQ